MAVALCITASARVDAFDLRLPKSSASLRVAITQSLTGEYHTDSDVLVGNPGDAYFDFKNRSQLVVMHGTTTFSLRVNGNWYLGVEDLPSGDPRPQSVTSVEKVSLSSIQRSFDVTAGDFYIRIGRGIALDMTKVDELTRDTSVRGGRLELRLGMVRGVVFGGWINPVDVDDATELRRKVPSDLVGGARLELRPHRNVRFGAHYVGAGLQARLGGRNATHILGATLEFPNVADRITLYAEVDYMKSVQDGGKAVVDGVATYFSGVLNVGPLAFLTEFRYYRKFDFRNVFGGEEDTYIYSRPPTLTRPEQQIFNNHDVLGPRLRVDLRIKRAILFGSISYFFRSDGLDSGFFDQGLWVVDGYGGLQTPIGGGNMEIQAGYRADTRTENTTGETITDYSQFYLEGEISVPIGSHNIEVQTVYRKVRKPGDDKFWDCTIGVSYRPSRFWAVGAVYEHSTEFQKIQAPDATPRTHFGSGQVTVNFTPASYARVFFGSTRGGLTCLDGFCRTVPPFIGVRTELVLRF